MCFDPSWRGEGRAPFYLQCPGRSPCMPRTGGAEPQTGSCRSGRRRYLSWGGGGGLELSVTALPAAPSLHTDSLTITHLSLSSVPLLPAGRGEGARQQPWVSKAWLCSVLWLGWRGLGQGWGGTNQSQQPSAVLPPSKDLSLHLYLLSSSGLQVFPLGSDRWASRSRGPGTSGWAYGSLPRPDLEGAD